MSTPFRLGPRGPAGEKAPTQSEGPTEQYRIDFGCTPLEMAQACAALVNLLRDTHADICQMLRLSDCCEERVCGLRERLEVAGGPYLNL